LLVNYRRILISEEFSFLSKDILSLHARSIVSYLRAGRRVPLGGVGKGNRQKNLETQGNC